MDRRRFAPNPLRAALAAALAAAFAPALHASSGPGLRLGGEFRVNATTAGHQNDPDIGMDGDGDAVAVWTEGSTSNECRAIMARSLPAGGAPRTPYQVNTSGATDRRFCQPVVALDAAGGMIVAWAEARMSGGLLLVDDGIWHRRYDTRGVATFPARVDAGTGTVPGRNPAVAAAPAGDRIVVWSAETSVWARRYLTDGLNRNAFEVVDASTESARPGVALNDAGDIVVVYTRAVDGDFLVYFMQFDGPDGFGAARPVYPVQDGTTCRQFNPQVAIEQDGSFVVAWARLCTGDEDVFARRFHADGTTNGSAFRVNAYTPGGQGRPSLALDRDGDFVVSWTSLSQDGSGYGVYARRYSDEQGVLTAGSEFRVPARTTDHQHGSAVAADADGEFAVVWTSVLQDGAGDGVYGQRFSGFENVDLSTVLTDSPDPATPAQVVRYSATVSNLHHSFVDPGVGTATGLAVDFGATGGTLAGAAGSGWTCQYAGTSARCLQNSRLLPGTSASLAFDVAPDGSGSVRGNARATAQQWDATPANDGDEEVTTVSAGDGTPDAFEFTDVAGAPLDSVVASETLVIGGIDVPVQASVSGPSARIQVNGGAWGTGPLTVVDGDSVRVRLRTATTQGTARSLTATIGGVSDTWTVITAPP